MPGLKVLICGGGIAGNTLAFWLSRAGHNVTVNERVSELRTSGLQIDLRGHGIEVLKRMGLEQGFRALGAKEEGLEFANKDGKVTAYFPANTSGKGRQSFTSEYEIMRGDLVQLLYSATKDKVRHRFGISVDNLVQSQGSVTASFSDGTSDVFDLVVGADGQGSYTRRMMLGPYAKNPLHHLGGATAYFTIPWKAAKAEQYRASFYMAPGGRSIMIRRSKPHQVQVYLMSDHSSEELRHVQKNDVDAEKAAFANIFADAGWKAKEVLAELDDVQDFHCERPGVVKLESWYQGRIALVGDAAYCPTYNTGMGTTSSIVGAYILAGEINKAETHTEGISEALESYDKIFRPFMDQVQKGVAENNGGWMGDMLSTWWTIAIFNFLLGIAAWLKVDVLSMFLRENVVDWTLPSYPQIDEKE